MRVNPHREHIGDKKALFPDDTLLALGRGKGTRRIKRKEPIIEGGHEKFNVASHTPAFNWTRVCGEEKRREKGCMAPLRWCSAS